MTLELVELEIVLGELAEEFPKFCDGAEEGLVLRSEELCAGIFGDTPDLSEEAFRTA